MKYTILLAGIILLMSSCNNYYKAVISANPNKPAEIISLTNQSKYFILRSDSLAFAMNNISITNDQKELVCHLSELPKEHQLYVSNKKKTKLIYVKLDRDGKTESGVLNEVHVYASLNENTAIGQQTITIDKIEKIEVINKDVGKSFASHALPTLLVMFGIVVAVCIAFATGGFAIGI